MKKTKTKRLRPGVEERKAQGHVQKYIDEGHAPTEIVKGMRAKGSRITSKAIYWWLENKTTMTFRVYDPILKHIGVRGDMTVDEAAAILKEVLEEITNFKDNEEQLDFILDVVKGFKAKANEK